MISHNRTSFMLCAIGGILMVISGASGTLGYLPIFAEAMDSLLDETFTLTLEIILGILAALTALGGLGVILSGFLMTTRYVEPGRILVMLSMGMGTLSLVMSLVQLAIAGVLIMPLTVQLSQSLGWIGAMLAIIARTVSEQRPIIEK